MSAVYCTPAARADAEVAEEDQLVADVERAAELDEMRVVRRVERHTWAGLPWMYSQAQRRGRTPREEPVRAVRARVEAVADLGAEAGQLVVGAGQREVVDAGSR